MSSRDAVSDPRFGFPLAPALAAVLTPERLPELGPGTPVAEVRPRLAALSEAPVCAPHQVAVPALAQACMAGLWLWWDFLDESHTISQGLDLAEGSYWHALMHRREEDFSNAKYWFRRVGPHPVFERLADEARRLAVEAFEKENLPREGKFLADGGPWNPDQFVDRVASLRHGRVRSSGGEGAFSILLRRIALREFELLWDHCRNGAAGLGERPSEPGISTLT